MSRKFSLKDKGNIKIDALYNIIVTPAGKPDYIAIDIYIEARSWYRPKKIMRKGKVTYSSKLKGEAWQIGYKYFVTKYKCSRDTIRIKITLLEKLGLLSRDFRTEYVYGKRFNNVMRLFVWKDTPHFYSEIGLERNINPQPPIGKSKDCEQKIKNPPVCTTSTDVRRDTPVLKNKDRVEEISKSSVPPISTDVKRDTPILKNKDYEQKIKKPSITCISTDVERDTPILKFKDRLSLKIRTAILKNKESIYVLPNNKEVEEEANAYSSSTVTSNNNLLGAKKKKKNKIIAEATQHKEIANTNLGIGTISYPATSGNEKRILTAKEEKEHYRNHRNREPCDNKLSNVDSVIPDLKENDYETFISRIQEEAAMKNQQLFPEILKTFDSFTSSEIIENITFEELTPSKVGINIKGGFMLSKFNREKLKTCIRNVYGKGVRMTNLTLIAPTDSSGNTKEKKVPPRKMESSVVPFVNKEWVEIKKKIAEYYPEKESKHIQTIWLNKLKFVRRDNKKIILSGSPFFIDEIYQRFATAIEDIVVKSKVGIVLEYEDKSQCPVEFFVKKTTAKYKL